VDRLERGDLEAAVGAGARGQQRADRHFVQFGPWNGGDIAVIFDGAGNRGLDPGAKPVFYGLGIGGNRRVILVVDVQDESAVGAKIVAIGLAGRRQPSGGRPWIAMMPMR